jgi:hypothetical protein
MQFIRANGDDVALMSLNGTVARGLGVMRNLADSAVVAVDMPVRNGCFSRLKSGQLI